jgi:hypothetical protein
MDRSRLPRRCAILLLVASCVLPATCQVSNRLFADCPVVQHDLREHHIHARLRSALNYPSWNKEQCITSGEDWDARNIGSIESVTSALTNTTSKQVRCAALNQCWSMLPSLLPGLGLNGRWRHCALVVVTAVFGGRDALRAPPKTAFPLITCFIAFVDEDSSKLVLAPGETGSRWHRIKVNFTSVVSNPRVQSRIFKLLLPQLFPESRWSMWHDAKLALSHDPWVVLANFLWKRNASIAGAAHYVRFAYHQEQDATVTLGMMSNETASKQRQHYTDTGMTMNNTGLLEGMMILRDHRTVAAPLISCLWWHQYVQFPPRDQTSFPYVSYMLGFRSNRSHEELEEIRKEASLALELTKGKSRFHQAVGVTYWSSMLNEVIDTVPICQLHHVAVERSHLAETDHLSHLSISKIATTQASSGRNGTKGPKHSL